MTNTTPALTIAVAGGTGTVGTHLTAVLADRGHVVRVLSRSEGVDLTTGAGLADRLHGVDAVVDVASVQTLKDSESEAFFRAVTTHLLAAGAEAGVRHHVALSIVGVDRAPWGYYAGKAAQERLVEDGPVPWTILRATQFHEFAGQVLAGARLGPIALAPSMRTRPVAAREVAERLADLVEAGPSGHATELVGPEELRLPDMVRAYARATGFRGPVVPVRLPGRLGRAQRDGSLTGGPGTDHATETFAAWLAGVSV